MRAIFLFAFFVSLSTISVGQDTVSVVQKAGKNITARYRVLKNKPDVKAGLYQLAGKKNNAIAFGVYNNNKRAGIWRFFDDQSKLMQVFDYNTDTLKYEAPEGESTTFNYVFDKKITRADLVTKPVRIGGRYYGYLPYLNLFEKPADLFDAPNSNIRVNIELLISPYGRLADFTYHVMIGSYARDLNVNINVMNDEDKTFIPGTINGEAVPTRIFIKCVVKDKHTLELISPI
ncbi:hypothetical protein C8P68_103141 [Mucilaginibacter yixingensis]|uniref:Uncharacterized protein n=1 Tax=Mucilaginibacter yixingensis TaxID=1295612 RepID=A0A2T5JAT3_9SPHI|nr:hypothetical protein [Mucilaginibacter yixingensis]PTQ97982.1 hypothetical protein C8P68_103141 [Mucilaginibacter yixingensis]